MDILEHLADGSALHFYGHELHLPSLPPVDMSVTRVVVAIWVAALLTAYFIWKAAKGDPRNPRGIHNLVEIVTLFLRKEIVLPFMHKDGLPFLPFLTTLFFFILFMNWLGLLPQPFGQAATGSILVTGALAAMTFVLIHFVGIRKYGLRRHFLNFFPPVPWPLYVIIVPVELLLVVMKPVALAIRLFANMLAGHCMILAFISMIFMVANMPLARWGAAGACSVAIVGIMLLEVLVGLIQAYVFVFLTAVFMGQALHADH